MKRFHVHLSVTDLARSVSFYSALFGQPPSLERPQYAKWLLQDPGLNFALSQRGHGAGLDHLGLQAESPEQLQAMTLELENAGLRVQDVGTTECCFARSEKTWLHDPQDFAWELFFSHEEALTPTDERPASQQPSGACCAPAARCCG
ncbi:glyoxalase/bleomycin resistance/dioxygenase family protein [Pseudomonas sp. CrR25]|nr:glyoxalase/bleomycin resistance/dioxygenase family protein [Pseudomonas sp. CrR25]